MIVEASDAPDLSPVTLERLGRALYLAGEIKEAAKFLRRAQRLHPGDFWVNVLLAETLVRQEPPEYEEAIGYTTALALRPDSPGLCYNIGVVLYEKGDLDGSIEYPA